jgi:low temperature requirement protein LtrA
MLGAVMLASLVMSVAIPEAFGERGLMFALAYVAIQLVRTLFAVLALEASHPLRPYPKTGSISTSSSRQM